MTSQAPFVTAQALYEKLKTVRVDNPLCTYTLERCETLAPTINRILELKKEKDALILAHSYVHPDIIYGVADHTGDSYGLALEAIKAKESTIVFPSVRFMAETAKILNPKKTVLDPNPNGGCSLADSVTAEDVLRLRDRHPDFTFICYVNTTAAVKAVCDICVTSSNVYKICEQVPTDKILFLPDKLMGWNIKKHLKDKGISKQVLLYDGSCYVHEQFHPEQVHALRKRYPDVTVLAHPECTPDVLKVANVVGSTSKMATYVKDRADKQGHYLLLTECGLVSRLQVEVPQAQLVGTCMMCKYMKTNNLEQIERVLKNPKPCDVVEIEESTRVQAKKCLDAMFTFET